MLDRLKLLWETAALPNLHFHADHAQPKQKPARERASSLYPTSDPFSSSLFSSSDATNHHLNTSSQPTTPLFKARRSEGRDDCMNKISPDVVAML
jgi:hypothetical protein